MSRLVICGPTKFHAIDESMTALVGTPEARTLLVEIAETYDYWHLPKGALREQVEQRHRELIEELRQLVGSLPRYVDDLAGLGRKISKGDLHATYAIPQCGMVSAGVAVPIGEAIARGLDWSKECARRNGILNDGGRGHENQLLNTRFVSPTGRYRAYKHAVDCEVCWLQGIGACEIFPLIARQEIESDVDPRLEELLA